MKILIIENERSIYRTLSLSLRQSNHEIYCAESLTEGYYLSQTQNMDLVIIEVDLMRPRSIDSSDFRGKPLLVLYDESHGYLKPRLNSGIRILQKPFPLSLFKKVVDDMLSQKVCELSA